MASIYEQRLETLQAAIGASGLDAMLIAPGANLFYLTGIEAHISTRLYLLVIPKQGRPKLALPAIEALGAEEKATFFDLIRWTDNEGPLNALRSAISGLTSSPNVAVDDFMASRFLLYVQSEMAGAKWSNASLVMKSVRGRKSKEEAQIMREAAAIADKTLAELVTQKFSGRSEQEIATEIERLLKKHGQSQVQFTIVGSKENGAKPHHNAGPRIIQPGDPIVLDFGGTYRGYQSDMTRMVVVRGGETDPEFFKVHAVVNDANRAAHKRARPGVTAESVDKAARDVITDAGYGEYFVHRTGHGIGIDVHEDPYIIQGNEEILEVGNAFSIEPGVYLPGRFGVRVEDVAIVTPEGCENIDLTPHDIIYVD